MRILHVFRSPVGGLFRHVRDLARGQAALGHDVGIFCDSSTGGGTATQLFAASHADCSLGIIQSRISKLPGLGDVKTALIVQSLAKKLKIDVIHGHGAKGGLYARLAGKLSGIPSVYTPHGGSLHYEWKKFPGPIFLGTERALAHAGSGLIFVCKFEKEIFNQKIGLAGRPSVVVHNGLWPEEFTAPQLADDATDLLFVGEMRRLKGVDVLLNALTLLQKQRSVTLTLVGDGSDLTEFKTLAASLQLGPKVRFVGRRSMNEALTMGRNMILPSRNESFPYVVLETIAAGVPILASDVGGISEVLPSSMLFNAGDSAKLAAKISTLLENPSQTKLNSAELIKSLGAELSAATMCQKIIDFYQTVTVR